MTTRARVLLPLLLVLLTGCGGLPLPSGVRDAAGARGADADSGSIVVVAPGPQPGMTATELVSGFLDAMSRSRRDRFDGRLSEWTDEELSSFAARLAAYNQSLADD